MLILKLIVPTGYSKSSIEDNVRLQKRLPYATPSSLNLVDRDENMLIFAVTQSTTIMASREECIGLLWRVTSRGDTQEKQNSEITILWSTNAQKFYTRLARQ